MDKRGLSNLVATVLIILLALAAVAIVWSFLQPSFNRAGQQTNLRSSCFLIELEPTNCQINGASATVTYRMKSDDQYFRDKVIAVVEDDLGAVSTAEGPKPGGPLQTESTDVDLTNLGGTEFEARVAAVVADGDLEEVCPESITIGCQNAGSPS